MAEEDDRDWRGRPRARRVRREDDYDDDRDRRREDYDDRDRRRRYDDYYDDYDADRLPAHRGGLILAFGLLAWFVCGIFGIVAYFLGTSDIRAMDEGRMDPSGRGLTQAGRWIGLIVFIIQAGVGILYLAFIAVMIAAGK